MTLAGPVLLFSLFFLVRPTWPPNEARIGLPGLFFMLPALLRELVPNPTFSGGVAGPDSRILGGGSRALFLILKVSQEGPVPMFPWMFPRIPLE